MTRVEEERESLLHMVAGDLAMPSLVKVVDSLISAVAQQTQNQYKEALANVFAACAKECTRQSSAAHAEGVAEGAEKERQRVRDEEDAESLRHDQECDRHARQKELGIDGLCDYIRTHPHDPSVLAPTKEGEK